MAAIRAGIPLAAQGYDSTPWEDWARPSARGDSAAPPKLFLLTDLMDFGVKSLQPTEPFYNEFLWAFHYQDTWAIAEYAEFWTAFLKHWPRRSGRGSKRDADAFAFALAAREIARAVLLAIADPSFRLRGRSEPGRVN